VGLATRSRLSGVSIAVALAAVSPCQALASGLVGVRAAHATGAQPSVATVSDAIVQASGQTTKIVFKLSQAVTPAAFVLAEPDRAIVDLPQVDFQLDPGMGRLESDAVRHGPVASFRFGLLAAGRSRIVVDLRTPARVEATIRKIEDRYELVVALTRTDRATFRNAARSSTMGAVVPETAAAAPAAPQTATIILDPGHGGPDTGAIVNGVVEKDVVLAFANRLAAKLRADGGFNVVMTRDSDVFIPLSERVRIARAANAALMISIHADTLTETADVSGATVYTVSDKASDAYAAKVAAKENAADSAVGVDGQQDTVDVNDILFDLTRQETRAYSHVFARTLVNYWKAAGRLNKNPQRSAGFVVLKAPDVPSVLLELGYLSSPADSAALTSEAWRGQATGRMAAAIESYFADRQGPAKAAAGVPLALRQASADPK
jgi:N-acetylmuramoyl-L-alanine amidase